MIPNLIETLELAPAATFAEDINRHFLLISRTPEGRAIIAEYAGRVRDLLGGGYCLTATAERAELAARSGEMFVTFEAGADAASALGHALWQTGAFPCPAAVGSVEWHRQKAEAGARIADLKKRPLNFPF